jgi:hypothetical protein
VSGVAQEIKKKFFPMKGWVWNSDGLRDPAKHCVIHEAVREHKLDFVFLSERREI